MKPSLTVREYQTLVSLVRINEAAQLSEASCQVLLQLLKEQKVSARILRLARALMGMKTRKVSGDTATLRLVQRATGTASSTQLGSTC